MWNAESGNTYHFVVIQRVSSEGSGFGKQEVVPPY